MRLTVAGVYSKVSHPSNWEVDFEMIISTKTRVLGQILVKLVNFQFRFMKRSLKNPNQFLDSVK